MVLNSNSLNFTIVELCERSVSQLWC